MLLVQLHLEYYTHFWILTNLRVQRRAPNMIQRLRGLIYEKTLEELKI